MWRHKPGAPGTFQVHPLSRGTIHSFTHLSTSVGDLLCARLHARPWDDGGKQETVLPTGGSSSRGEMDTEQEMTDGSVCRSQGLTGT